MGKPPLPWVGWGALRISPLGNLQSLIGDFYQKYAFLHVQTLPPALLSKENLGGGGEELLSVEFLVDF